VPGDDDYYRHSRFIGVSGEGIYPLLSPYTHCVGVALYTEPTIGTGFVESENRPILQKNFHDDRRVVGFNFKYAPEWRRRRTLIVLLKETDVNADFGVLYRFSRNWSAGLEFLNEREFNRFNFTDESNSGYFFGPVLHYVGKNFSATATFVEQLPCASIYSDTWPGAIVGGETLTTISKSFECVSNSAGTSGATRNEASLLP